MSFFAILVDDGHDYGNINVMQANRGRRGSADGGYERPLPRPPSYKPSAPIQETPGFPYRRHSFRSSRPQPRSPIIIPQTSNRRGIGTQWYQLRKLVFVFFIVSEYVSRLWQHIVIISLLKIMLKRTKLMIKVHLIYRDHCALAIIETHWHLRYTCSLQK